MADSDAAGELELVRTAIRLGARFRGCCEWDDRAARRIDESPPCTGLTSQGIKELLIEKVTHDESLMRQVVEQRSEYGARRFYYKVILPIPEFVRGLFVELTLADDDPDCPSVVIVNAHQQGR